MTEAIYEGANFQWAATSIALIALFIWTAAKSHTLEARVFAIGIVFLELGIVGRILFWEIATYIGPYGAGYYPEIVELKWIVWFFAQFYLIGTLLVTGPVLKKFTKHWVLMSIGVAFGTFLYGALTYNREIFNG